MRTSLTVFCVGACLCMAGCGDDDNGGFKPQDNFSELTSPENVLFNFAAAYSEMDYEHFRPLIRTDYVFLFNPQDFGLPGIPHSGIWGRSEELQTHQHMLDTAYVPQDDPELRIEAMNLELALSGEPSPSSQLGAPEGTVEGFVVFDWRVTTVGEIDFYVGSRPRFFFAPDSTKTPVTWSIWRIEDAPFEQSGMAALFGASVDIPGSNPAVRSAEQAKSRPAVEQRSWGSVKLLYR